jgi:hypothetical protein
MGQWVLNTQGEKRTLRSSYGPRFLWLLGALFSSACTLVYEPDVGPAIDRSSDSESTANGAGGAPSSGGEGGENAGAAGNGDGSSGSGASAGDGSGGASGGASGAADVDGGASSGGDGGSSGGNSPPDNGCAVKDSNPGDDVSFAGDVMPVLAACRCHDPNNADPVGMIETGLTIDGFDNLMMGGDTTGTQIVVPGNPCDSIILQKLSETPPFGARMPKDGPYLTLEERQLISDWIKEGAKNN